MSCSQDLAHASVTTAPAKPAPSKSSFECEQCRDADTCCDLLCFERPNYFCGHLLTDVDLLREQNYFREKNKLYHRALHGHGIVCGLRIMCDSECEGYVRIEKGYAIDDCGNDLVVCNPLRFNVLKALHDKGWIIEDAKKDPCEPEHDDEECHTRQCFYIAACYHEEPGDFTAPFIPGCKPRPVDCEPTRIRELVTFDVLNELPPKEDWLDELRKRVEACFDLFSKGQFAQYVRQHGTDIEQILTGKEGGEVDCKKLFCDLRGLLLLYLKKHPDHYDCTLEAEIRAIPLPTFQDERLVGCREAICKLIELATRYVYTCVMNEFIPRCTEPAKAACVVLGTVEVERGQIIQVCNCPREYVWSFANFFQVLVATLLSDALCEDKTRTAEITDDPCHSKGRHVCCRRIDIDCEQVAREVLVNAEALKYRGTATFDAVSRLRNAVAAAFDFTRRDAYAPSMFNNLTQAQAAEAATKLNLKAEFVRAPLAAPVVAPFDILRRIGLATTDEPLVLATDDQGRVAASYAEVSLTQTGKVVVTHEEVAREIDGLRTRIAELEAKVSGQGPNNPTRRTRRNQK
jgi:hypothetical protein